VTRPRIHLPRDMQAGSRYKLADEDRKYVGSVLRLAEGDPILLFNGSGREGEGIIDHLNDKEVSVKILRAWPVSPKKMAITLAQSLPKSGKMDFILQKATELGIHRIIPFVSRRSVPKLDRDKAAAKQSRWQKIVMEAARQCRSAHIPEVNPVVSFAEMLEQAPEGSLRIIFWEEETVADIKGLLGHDRTEKGNACFIVVGPEGGFTADEVMTAKDMGFLPASLGRHILKTDTAALTVITIIQYEKGEFFNLTGEKET
jgi:16S rRNA (uracil1498-N3)-methyltransferase